MGATAFQRKRRELLEQTSVSSRMNEDGKGDPYAKSLDNYDEQGIQDIGMRHQAGSPPPYSLTPHVPEADVDLADSPLTSVQLREGEEPPYSDQKRYDALGVRDEATAEASLANAETGVEEMNLKSMKKDELVTAYVERGGQRSEAEAMKKSDLVDSMKD